MHKYAAADNVLFFAFNLQQCCDTGDWQESTALMTIGGGFDKGVIQALGLKGLSLVQDYVHQGGAYLGLCSGGYLACDSIQFDQGGPLQVCGERHLKFFPGIENMCGAKCTKGLNPSVLIISGSES